METVLLVLPLFALIFLGYGLRKTSFLSSQFAFEANRLVYYITLPATIIAEMIKIAPEDLGRPELVIGYPLVVILTAALALALSLLIRYERRGAFAQICYRANLAYFGLPIASTAFGAESLAFISVIIAIGIIINTALSITVLKLLSPQEDRTSIRARLATVVRNPLIIAVALGLGIGFSGITLPGVVIDTVELIGRISLPLVLLVVGFSLSFSRLGGSLPVNLVAAAIKLAAMPLIAYAVLTGVFGAEGLIRDVTVVMSAMPTAAVSQSFAARFGADEQVTAAGVSLNTLLAMLTVPLWLAVV